VLALMQTFGGPPEWVPWDVTATDFSESVGRAAVAIKRAQLKLGHSKPKYAREMGRNFDKHAASYAAQPADKSTR
jgi:hypothetical protein